MNQPQQPVILGQPSPSVAETQADGPTNLGSIEWLDTHLRLRQWFAVFLFRAVPRIYSEMPRSRAYSSMKEAMRRLIPKLFELPTAEQLQKVQSTAHAHGLTTTREALLFELHYRLTRTG